MRTCFFLLCISICGIIQVLNKVVTSCMVNNCVNRYAKIALFCVLFFVSFPVDVKAFGVSPSSIKIDDLLSSNVIDQHILVSRGSNFEIKEVRVFVEGEGKDAVRILEKSIKFSDQQVSSDLKFQIAPEKFAVGDHRAKIIFQPVIVPSSDAPARLELSLSTLVQFSVTDTEKKLFSVDGISFVRKGKSDLYSISGILHNRGNAPIRVDAYIAKFSDLRDFNLATIKKVPIEPIEIHPKTSLPIHIESSFSLPISEYNIQFTFLEQDSRLGSVRSHAVTGLLQSYSWEVSLIKYRLIFLGVAVLLVGLSGFLILRKKLTI